MPLWLKYVWGACSKGAPFQAPCKVKGRDADKTVAWVKDARMVRRGGNKTLSIQLMLSEN